VPYARRPHEFFPGSNFTRVLDLRQGSRDSVFWFFSFFFPQVHCGVNKPELIGRLFGVARKRCGNYRALVVFNPPPPFFPDLLIVPWVPVSFLIESGPARGPRDPVTGWRSLAFPPRCFAPFFEGWKRTLRVAGKPPSLFLLLSCLFLISLSWLPFPTFTFRGRRQPLSPPSPFPLDPRATRY